MSLRPVVKIEGPTDVRVQCGCPEHRASGGICAHAIAVLLTSLRAEATPKEPEVAPATDGGPVQAWDIRLSPRFETEWAAGKLSLRVSPSMAGVSEPDTRLSAWLAGRKLPAPPRGGHALRVEGEDLASFLDAAAGHPRISIEGRREPFRLEEDPGLPLRLADSRLENGRVILDLAGGRDTGTLLLWGDSPALAGPDSAARLPAASAGAGWMEQVRTLLATGRLSSPVEPFLAGYNAWSDLFEAPQPGWLGSLRLTGAQPDFELELEGSLEAVDALLRVRYPGMAALPLPPPEESIPGLPRLAPDGHLQARDAAAEQQARRRLFACGFSEGADAARFRLRGREAILEFIADELPTLRKQWLVKTGPRFSEVSTRVHVVSPEIREVADHGTSCVFELSFQTGGGKRIPATELRRILRGGKRTVRLSNGSELVVSRSCGELVNPLMDELGIGRPDEQIQLSGADAILFRNVREILSNQLQSSGLINDRETTLSPVSIEGMTAALRPYQAEGAAWLADRLKRIRGVLLADEMGLGKTIQTIACINHLNQEEAGSAPVLVVAPTSLLGNWTAEISRFAPRLKTLLLHGAGRDKLRDSADGMDVIVTSYGTLVRDLAFHLKREYRLVVADEASLLRNPDADVSKALVKLNARGRIALTGTPVENRMQDLWSIFRFVAPGYLGERTDFRQRYEIPASEGPVPGGLLERLRLRVSPFVLRRTKDQVARDLPDKMEIDEWLTLSPEQAALYSGLAKAGLEEVERVRRKQGEGAGRMHLLTLLLRLRQICVDPALVDSSDQDQINAVKIERLLELLSEREENSKKTLVFSQFAKNLRNIEERLSGTCSRVFRIDGSTRNRQALVDAFQAEPGAAVFLISIKAGGYGLNLTAADAVIHMDPWWNPAVEAQATDRAHRIGQTRPVTVYRLLTRDTVEERVRRLQAHKRAIIDAATGGTDDLPRNWTTKDLEGLLA